MLTSPHNELLKLARSLHTRKGRHKAGLFLVDSPRAIATMLASGATLAHLLYSSGCEAGLLSAARQAGAALVEVDPNLLRDLAAAETPAGCVALVRAPADAPPSRFSPPLLILDAIRDPGNVGTLLRCADAVGAQVALCDGCADPLSPKVVRASAGAVVRVRWWRAEPRALQGRLESEGLALWTLDSGGGEDLLAAELPARVAIVVGNEAHGLSEAWQDAGRRCTLPMRTGAESLNAAMAGVVALYTLVRQHGLSVGDDGAGPSRTEPE